MESIPVRRSTHNKIVDRKNTEINRLNFLLHDTYDELRDALYKRLPKGVPDFRVALDEFSCDDDPVLQKINIVELKLQPCAARYNYVDPHLRRNAGWNAHVVEHLKRQLAHHWATLSEDLIDKCLTGENPR